MAIAQLELPVGLNAETVHSMYEQYFKSFNLISVLPKGMTPEVVAVKNTARIELGIDVSNPHENGKQTLCITTVLDNLIKGGAGQAIQNYNLMVGQQEAYLLDKPGMWP